MTSSEFNDLKIGDIIRNNNRLLSYGGLSNFMCIVYSYYNGPELISKINIIREFNLTNILIPINGYYIFNRYLIYAVFDIINMDISICHIDHICDNLEITENTINQFNTTDETFKLPFFWGNGPQGSYSIEVLGNE